MMKFYNQQHLFYCGIDLYAKTLHVCVLDQNGEKCLHKNLQCQDVDTFLQELQPFRENLVVGCESTFNWYWLADLMSQQQIPFILGHALYMKAIQILKRELGEVKKLAERLEKKRGKGRAMNTQAVKLGRTIFYMLRNDQAFDLKRLIGS